MFLFMTIFFTGALYKEKEFLKTFVFMSHYVSFCSKFCLSDLKNWDGLNSKAFLMSLKLMTCVCKK